MVSLLALASKPLYEREILELRSENERLKLKLFWKDYSVDKLKKAMRFGNIIPDGSPYCQCNDCLSYERAPWPRKRVPLHGSDSGAAANRNVYDEDFYRRPCTFGPWFARTAARFGLTMKKAVYSDETPGPTEIPEHDSNADLYVLDMDCHLVNEDGPAWTRFTYGRRLWDAKTVESPELKKLEKFFNYFDQCSCVSSEEEMRGRSEEKCARGGDDDDKSAQ